MPQNRRQFLARSGLAMAAGFAVEPSVRAAAPPATRIMDTHTHFYDPRRKEGVPWPDRGDPLYRPVYPKDWKAVASPHGVNETVVVEASEWVQDNDWILNLAAQEKSIVGFVGNLEPMKPDFGSQLRRLAENPLFVGIRRAGNFLYDNITKAEFRRGLKQVAERGLELDVNDRTLGGLQAVAQLAKDIPDLRIVVDHCGKPDDAKHLSDDWKQGMTALAAQKNVYCKVSGLMELSDAAIANYGHGPKDPAYYLPILDHCWNCFGEDRLIYGSNWPVCEIGGSYADQFRIVTEYFTAKGAAACEKYFWKNAFAAYRWKKG